MMHEHLAQYVWKSPSYGVFPHRLQWVEVKQNKAKIGNYAYYKQTEQIAEISFVSYMQNINGSQAVFFQQLINFLISLGCEEVIIDGTFTNHRVLRHFGFEKVNNQYILLLSDQTALVLGGGGAHGAYEVGVYLAMHEIGFEPRMLIGTSVGALNAALIHAMPIRQLKRYWAKVSNEMVFENADTLPLSNLPKLAFGNVTGQSTVDTAPLRDLVSESVFCSPKRQWKFEPQVYAVTTQMNQVAPKVTHLNVLPKERVIDWLMASSTFFPVMSPRNFDNQLFIDGGFREDMPIGSAIELGMKRLIAVDIQGMGISLPTVRSKDTSLTMLKSLWPLGDILNFSPAQSMFNQVLGYLETMRYFNGWLGDYYTFIKNANPQLQMPLALRKFLTQQPYQNWWQRSLERAVSHPIQSSELFRTLLEWSAFSLEVSPLKIYNYDELHQATKKALFQSADTELTGNHTKMLQFLKVIEAANFNSGNLVDWYVREPLVVASVYLLIGE